MSLGRSHKVIGRKSLTLVVAFILSIVAFAVFAGEARAQQQSTVVKQSIVITDGEAIELVGESSSAEIPQPDLMPGPVSEPLPKQAPGAAFILESSGPPVGPALPAEDAGAELASKLEVPPSQVVPAASEPVVFEENKALSSRAEEGSSTVVPREAWPTPLPEKGPANSTPIEPSSSAVYWQPAASVPTVPVLEGSHALSSWEAATGGGQVGSAGGVAPLLLLLCVLVSGSLLLRRDGKLSWAFCEPPKLSSALLLPLERPG